MFMDCKRQNLRRAFGNKINALIVSVIIGFCVNKPKQTRWLQEVQNKDGIHETDMLNYVANKRIGRETNVYTGTSDS